MPACSGRNCWAASETLHSGKCRIAVGNLGTDYIVLSEIRIYSTGMNAGDTLLFLVIRCRCSRG